MLGSFLGDNALEVVIEEFLSPLCWQQYFFGRQSQHLHHEKHLLFLAFTREDGKAREELDHYAPEGPDIDGRGVANPQNDLWSPVESALDVGVELLVLEAAAANIDDPDAAFILFLQENILGLEVTVDDVVLLEESEGLKDLDGEPSNQVMREP